MASLGTVAHDTGIAYNRAAANQPIPGGVNPGTIQVSQRCRPPVHDLAVLIRPGHESLGARRSAAAGRPRQRADSRGPLRRPRTVPPPAHLPQKKLKPRAATLGFTNTEKNHP